MSLKKRTKVSAEFSMASMTDIIFLLLLFFIITSTVVQTNVIKVLLPQSTKTERQKTIVNITIDAQHSFFIARDKGATMEVDFDEIEPFLRETVSDNPEMFVALYADESIPYREIVRILDIANKNQFKLVLATRPLDNKNNK